jgi:hypothetical protein
MRRIWVGGVLHDRCYIAHIVGKYFSLLIKKLDSLDWNCALDGVGQKQNLPLQFIKNRTRLR